MKKIFALLLLSVVLFCSCEKDEMPLSYEEQLNIDIEKIITYLDDNNLVAESTSMGLYYIIEEVGTGNYPTQDSIAVVEYVGRYLSNGQVFERGTINNTDDQLPLSGFIPGWRLGIPLFNEGARGKLFIPSVLGYGSSDYGPIPANSVLIFDVSILSVSENK